jgi:hypothetical protein
MTRLEAESLLILTLFQPEAEITLFVAHCIICCIQLSNLTCSRKASRRWYFHYFKFLRIVSAVCIISTKYTGFYFLP